MIKFINLRKRPKYLKGTQKIIKAIDNAREAGIGELEFYASSLCVKELLKIPYGVTIGLLGDDERYGIIKNNEWVHIKIRIGDNVNEFNNCIDQ